MDAEKLLDYVKKCGEDLNIKEYNVLISPTMDDPKELTNDVSFFVMEIVKGGTITRYIIVVKELESIRQLKYTE